MGTAVKETCDACGNDTPEPVTRKTKVLCPGCAGTSTTAQKTGKSAAGKTKRGVV